MSILSSDGFGPYGTTVHTMGQPGYIVEELDADLIKTGDSKFFISKIEAMEYWEIYGGILRPYISRYAK